MRMTVRAKLTALYGAMVVTGGGLLVTAIYLLVRMNLAGQLVATVAPARRVSSLPQPPQAQMETILLVHARDFAEVMLTKLLVVSGASLAVLAVLAVVVGWWVSGRVLRPVHRISATARELSSENLHRRIALVGPDDELTELADTFDEMLARLEAAFDSQRRFIANASHELRTPLAIQRAAVQVGLADERSAAVTRVAEQLLAANRRSERLIDGLLTLARSDRGVERREPVPLHTITAQELRTHAAEAERHGIVVRARLDGCWVLGDPVLLPLLVTNLVANAVRHNTDGGTIEIRTDRSAGLVVTNTGPRLDQDHLADLFEPFRRGDGRTAADGAGLGLSIVQSIARAHGGVVHATARSDGGLRIQIELPVATATGVDHAPRIGGRTPAPTRPGPRRRARR